MVLAERNSDCLRNGRRSRGPSPNGHASESSSDGESIGEGGARSLTHGHVVPEEKIRVGRDFQAICPVLTPVAERRLDQVPDKALLVWSPTVNIPDLKLDEYICLAKEKYGYNGEQALGMLFWHKHDLERAIMDLSNFTPFPDEWTVEDKVLFEQAFQFHGKSFHRIRQMLPDKTIASLVKYYYSWKKTRTRTSLMDRQARKIATNRDEGSEVGSEHGSNTDSDGEDKILNRYARGPVPPRPSIIQYSSTNLLPPHIVRPTSPLSPPSCPFPRRANRKWPIHRAIRGGIQRKSGSPPRSTQNSDDPANQKEGATSCSNCGVSCTTTYATTNKGSMCNTCFQHWRRTGTVRPTTGPVKRDRHSHLLLRHKRKPPRGMYINHDDLITMAATTPSAPPMQGDQVLKAMDREIISLKRQVQNNKQVLSTLKRKTAEGIDMWRPADNNYRINARWTQDELLLAVQGIRKYGKDFKAIAEVIGTKTEAHLRTYFVNYRRRYNLDVALKEFEAENGPIVDNEESKEDKIDIDGLSDGQGSDPSTPNPGGTSPINVLTIPPPLNKQSFSPKLQITTATK